LALEEYSAGLRREQDWKRLPHLLDDIREIAEPNAQVDATLRAPRRYLKLTAERVREQLIEQKNYRDEDLPKRRTISTILNKLGYRLRKESLSFARLLLTGRILSQEEVRKDSQIWNLRR
jgi:hypothetical protein